MGKSCVRFKKTDDIPFDLIGELARKVSVQDWIGFYEKNYLGVVRVFVNLYDCGSLWKCFFLSTKA